VVITYRSRADDARTVVAAIQAQGRKAAAVQLDTAATKTFDGFAEELKRTLREEPRQLRLSRQQRPHGIAQGHH
jgi:hypothetical protein